MATGKKITEYTNTVAAFDPADLLDVSKLISTGPDVYESQKVPFSVLKTAVADNIYANNGTLAANRSVAMDGKTLSFTRAAGPGYGNTVAFDFAETNGGKMAIGGPVVAGEKFTFYQIADDTQNDQHFAWRRETGTLKFSMGLNNEDMFTNTSTPADFCFNVFTGALVFNQDGTERGRFDVGTGFFALGKTSDIVARFHMETTDNSNANYAVIVENPTATPGTVMAFKNDGTAGFGSLPLAGVNYYFANRSTLGATEKLAVFKTASGDVMSINNNGRVAIGTTAVPAFKLTMGATQTMGWEATAGEASARGWGMLNDRTTYGDFSIMTETTAGGGLNTVRQYFDANGQTGFGISASLDARVHVVGTATVKPLRVDASTKNNAIVVDTDGTVSSIGTAQTVLIKPTGEMVVNAAQNARVLGVYQVAGTDLTGGLYNHNGGKGVAMYGGNYVAGADTTQFGFMADSQYGANVRKTFNGSFTYPFIVDPSGRVYINPLNAGVNGTAAAALHIVGEGGNASTTTHPFRITNANGTLLLNMRDDSAFSLANNSGNTFAMYNTGDGYFAHNLMVGEASVPNARLHAKGTASVNPFRVDASTFNNAIFVDINGKTAMGHNSPVDMLHVVNGTGREVAIGDGHSMTSLGTLASPDRSGNFNGVISFVDNTGQWRNAIYNYSKTGGYPTLALLGRSHIEMYAGVSRVAHIKEGPGASGYMGINTDADGSYSLSIKGGYNTTHGLKVTHDINTATQDLWAARFERTGTNTADNIAVYAIASGSSANNYAIKASGKINMASLPTSSAGLVAGDIWNDAGTLKIV